MLDRKEVMKYYLKYSINCRLKIFLCFVGLIFKQFGSLMLLFQIILKILGTTSYLCEYWYAEYFIRFINLSYKFQQYCLSISNQADYNFLVL